MNQEDNIYISKSCCCYLFLNTSHKNMQTYNKATFVYMFRDENKLESCRNNQH